MPISRTLSAWDGDVYGNYNVVFNYPNNLDVTFSSTQFSKGWWDVTALFRRERHIAIAIHWALRALGRRTMAVWSFD